MFGRKEQSQGAYSTSPLDGDNGEELKPKTPLSEAQVEARGQILEKVTELHKFSKIFAHFDEIGDDEFPGTSTMDLLDDYLDRLSDEIGNDIERYQEVGDTTAMPYAPLVLDPVTTH